jgi:hypothetical protein
MDLNQVPYKAIDVKSKGIVLKNVSLNGYHRIILRKVRNHLPNARSNLQKDHNYLQKGLRQLQKNL